jgi:hypothetical protein
MSLLSTFVVNQLVKELEAEFASHEPELQQAFVNEITAAVASVMAWANEKLSKTTEAPK